MPVPHVHARLGALYSTHATLYLSVCDGGIAAGEHRNYTWRQQIVYTFNDRTYIITNARCANVLNGKYAVPCCICYHLFHLFLSCVFLLARFTMIYLYFAIEKIRCVLNSRCDLVINWNIRIGECSRQMGLAEVLMRE